jgi:hypothetical protein
VACDCAEGHAPLVADVMQQLALVLGEVFAIGLEQRPPEPTIQIVELFGVRLVRHSVQYSRLVSKGLVEEKQ